MRKRARIDDNQREIVAALRAVGAQVQSLATIGDGCPDILVYWKDRTFTYDGLHLMEIKDGAKPPSKRRLTPAEADFATRWPVEVVCNVREALAVIGIDTDLC